MAYIEFRDVVKEYHTEGASIKALDGANFIVEKGELQSYWAQVVLVKQQH